MAGESSAERWDPEVRVVVSPRRRRTVGARVVDGVLEVRVPQWMPVRERQQWAERMKERIGRQVTRARAADGGLQERAERLNRLYFGGRLRWNSIVWSRSSARWGSCNTGAQLINVAEKARSLPGWVLDYIVVHELAHLVHVDHDPDFWEAVGAYPLAERARGYLIAVDHRAGGPLDGEPD